jgi:hypothetical protein
VRKTRAANAPMLLRIFVSRRAPCAFTQSTDSKTFPPSRTGAFGPVHRAFHFGKGSGKCPCLRTANAWVMGAAMIFPAASERPGMHVLG